MMMNCSVVVNLDGLEIEDMAEKESKENIEWICKDCYQMRKQDWQDHNENTVIKKGDFVKVALEDKSNNAVEHCWLDVDRVSEDGNIIWGILDNIPICLTNLKLGDGIIVQRGDVEEHRSR